MAARRPKQHAERLAVLETEMEQVRTVQETILAKQDSMLLELSRYRGAFGLAVIILSAVGTALIMFKDVLMAKFGLKV